MSAASPPPLPSHLLNLAFCRTAMDLVAELEFVWNQIKNNSPSSSTSSPKRGNSEAAAARPSHRTPSGADGPMKVLSPMSEDDEAEHDYQHRIGPGEGEEAEESGEHAKKEGNTWSRKVESAIVRLSAEMAALREQITAGREWRLKRERSVWSWIGWIFYVITKHLAIDALLLGILRIWMRRKKDRRLEDHVRGALRVLREYVAKALPSR